MLNSLNKPPDYHLARARKIVRAYAEAHAWSLEPRILEQHAQAYLDRSDEFAREMLEHYEKTLVNQGEFGRSHGRMISCAGLLLFGVGVGYLFLGAR